MTEMTGLIVGLVLTLLVYSYLLGDNPLYRLAIHVLVGVSAAYAAVVVTQQVIVPVFARIRQNPADPDNLLWLVPIFFALLLLLKWLPSISWLGNSTIALLIGIGAAVALVGAVMGTLWPQVTAVDDGSPIFTGQGIVVAVLTVCTLLLFQFTGGSDLDGNWRQPLWRRGVSTLGRVVMTVTFGVLFASVLNTSLILLADRVGFFLTQFLQR